MSLFSINFKLVADRILPTHKRGFVNLSWLGALLTPLQTFRNTVFDTFRPDINTRTKYNSQTVVLEQILNDVYGVTVAPFIYIVNSEGTTVDALIFRNEAEGFPPIFFRNDSEIPDAPVYFRNESETLTDFDFIVHVPAALFATDENQIRATINSIKLIGVNYDVIPY
jgi:hypothetical protein